MIEENVLREKTEAGVLGITKSRRTDKGEFIKDQREEAREARKKSKKWFHRNQKDKIDRRNDRNTVVVVCFIFSLQLLPFHSFFFFVKNYGHFSFGDDFILIAHSIHEETSHNC